LLGTLRSGNDGRSKGKTSLISKPHKKKEISAEGTQVRVPPSNEKIRRGTKGKKKKVATF